MGWIRQYPLQLTLYIIVSTNNLHPLVNIHLEKEPAQVGKITSNLGTRLPGNIYPKAKYLVGNPISHNICRYILSRNVKKSNVIQGQADFKKEKKDMRILPLKFKLFFGSLKWTLFRNFICECLWRKCQFNSVQ